MPHSVEDHSVGFVYVSCGECIKSNFSTTSSSIVIDPSCKLHDQLKFSTVHFKEMPSVRTSCRILTFYEFILYVDNGT